ncbi:MAG: GntR family transcriptional regulator [Bacteroidota bacterium]
MNYIKIEGHSEKPKYQQIIQSVIDAIDNNTLQLGDKLPSLNQLCKTFSLSQDTALMAYNDLKSKGIVASAVGKGYFVSSINTHQTNRVFLLFDRLTLYKENLYNIILDKFKNKGSVDIFFHHNNKEVFHKLINEAAGQYSSYIIMPIIDTGTLGVLAELPVKKVFILDVGRNLLGHKYAYVCQNFEKDVYNCLKKGKKELSKYQKIYLVNPDKNIHATEMQKGISKFTKANKFEFDTIKNPNQHKIEKHAVYLTIKDIDLVDIIKKANDKNLIIGRDIGIISYNKSPLKEVMANGITTISTDFEEMGKMISNMILNNKREKIDNKVELIIGGSL